MALTTEKQQGISRRDFIKACSMVTGNAFFGFTPGKLAKAKVQHLVNIPPSLALHSSDGLVEFLPDLLNLLQENGFTGTTYQKWVQGLLKNKPVFNPVIISIDDISLAQNGCARFDTFVQMKEWIQAAGMTAVFGVITQPVINDQPQTVQDETRWDMMAQWVKEGFELASHTTCHSNFNAIDTAPRPDFKTIDYHAEIVDSAKLIEEKLGERGINYQVRTLITPYGSGYSYKLPEHTVHSGIIEACQQTNIQFVVGIVEGRTPLSFSKFMQSNNPIYVGRIPPAYLNQEDGQRFPLAAQTLSWLQSWQKNYHQ